MRLHSNVISYTDIVNATQGLPGVYASASQHKSRTHKAAFEVTLTGNSFYYPNGGNRGSNTDSAKAATWDEWGVFLGRLYVIDPEIMCGNASNPVYQNAEHYHWSTGNRFFPEMGDPKVTLGIHAGLIVNLPADTHPRHKWSALTPVATGAYHVNACTKCSAVRRFMSYGRKFDEIGLVSS